MDEFIPVVVSRFSDFLSQNQSNIKKLSKSSIISFFTPLNLEFNKINLDEVRKNFERSFYFEKPFEEIRFLGIDQITAIEENGSGRFASTDKKINVIKENFFCNWPEESRSYIPLFLGAMKFTVEHSDNEWKDFNDSTWFIPEFLFFEKDKKTFLLFNFFFGSAILDNSILERFGNKLEHIISRCVIKAAEQLLPSLRQILGNEPKFKKKWKNTITEALNEIEAKGIRKVVLSRKIEVLLSGEPNLVSAANKFRKNYFDCFIFIYNHKDSSFLGATPERLAKFYNAKVELDAMAGSAPRGDTESEDLKIENDSLRNEKNIKEHQFVIDFLLDSIKSHAEEIEEINSLSVKKLNNIQHLHTKILASLKNRNSIFRFLADVYPTPAVCGVPKENALSLIKKLEQQNRGLYSGILGWFNFFDHGEFVISIRSAVTIKNKVVAFAGGGIVDSSDPEEEFKETELKFKPILSLFSNEN